jgi:hypothetical protein
VRIWTGAGIGTQVVGSTGAMPTGPGNTVFGQGACLYTTAISDNTIIGYQACLNMTSGNENICVGRSAGSGIISATRNTYLGTNTGIASSGSNNIGIGYSAGNTSTASNEIVIGASATGNGTNTITLGNTSATTLFTPPTIRQVTGTSLTLGDGTTTTGVIIPTFGLNTTDVFVGSKTGSTYLKTNKGLQMYGSSTNSFIGSDGTSNLFITSQGNINFTNNAGDAIGAYINTGGIFTNAISSQGTGADIKFSTFYLGSDGTFRFFTRSSNNTSAEGYWGFLNSGGWNFQDGDTSPSQSCGINSIGFYLPNCGYFLTGGRYNTKVSNVGYNSADMVLYNNGGGQTVITTLGGTGSRAVIVSANGTLSAPVSDARLKANLTPITPVLEKILALTPLTYIWNSESDMKNHPLYDTFIQYGFTAQDIQAQFPDFVYDFKIAEKSYLGYDDRKLIPILIKAFQEQHAEISELKTTISTLQSQLESLKTSVDKLTQKV